MTTPQNNPSADEGLVEAMQYAIEDVLAAWLREDGSVPDDALGSAALAAARSHGGM